MGEGWEYTRSWSSIVHAMDTVSKHNRVQWVSWPGESISEGSQDAMRQSLMRRFNVVPVFLNKQLAELYFQQFCCPRIETTPGGTRLIQTQEVRPAVTTAKKGGL